MCHVEKSHSVRPSRSPLRLSFYVFFQWQKNSCSTKTPQNILEKVISTYNHYYGYYESKNGEKKAPRKDTQTSVVMGWVLTKTTIMCAHKRSHE